MPKPRTAGLHQWLPSERDVGLALYCVQDVRSDALPLAIRGSESISGRDLGQG